MLATWFWRLRSQTYAPRPRHSSIHGSITYFSSYIGGLFQESLQGDRERAALDLERLPFVPIHVARRHQFVGFQATCCTYVVCVLYTRERRRRPILAKKLFSIPDSIWRTLSKPIRKKGSYPSSTLRALDDHFGWNCSTKTIHQKLISSLHHIHPSPLEVQLISRWRKTSKAVASTCVCLFIGIN